MKGNYRATSHYLQLFIKSQNEIFFLPQESAFCIQTLNAIIALSKFYPIQN